jgi:hypothetical protein
MEVTTAEPPTIKGEKGSFRTPELVVDEAGNFFYKTSIEMVIDGRRNIILLDATKTELLLKLMEIAPYAE